MKVVYTAFAFTPRKTWGVLTITRENGRQVSQVPTGEEFPPTKKGRLALSALLEERNRVHEVESIRVATQGAPR